MAHCSDTRRQTVSKANMDVNRGFALQMLYEDLYKCVSSYALSSLLGEVFEKLFRLGSGEKVGE